jgi:pantoate--beta-alanine ligase
MKVFNSVKEWLSFRDTHKDSIGFCPTMGALHQGHLSLCKKAKEENASCLVSIFLNPTQFNNPEDLEKYPVDIEGDLTKLEDAGVDFVLLPKYEELYKDNYRFRVSEDSFSKELCGAHRPGHFDGVLSVVMKLLNISGATTAYFGEKDYQQYLLIKDMVDSFFLPIEIKSVATVREESGLALSSRNKRLSPEAIKKAPVIYKTISRTDLNLEQKKQNLETEGFEVEYIEEKFGRTFIAANIENIRLIDNV